ncbi:histidine phosphatase family protein [Bacillus badius]|uniref:histidine phosphatase family protein n=1 Tax=Bacillus badius TaxID=1455 RepID=UPI0005ADD1F2|nr:histidine phosphatase family protein [Bacillus badius]KIL72189.1 Alpha-ribazole-5'-phosphate phosphatase [Bacillus badius]
MFMDDLVVIGLYRHGVTTDNEKKAFSGWTNSLLSETGKKELEHLRNGIPFYEKIIASDLQRCVDTAAFFWRDTSIDTWPEFREMNFGFLEGKTHKELEHVEEYKTWLQDPFSSPLPGGETYEQFGRRVMVGWNRWLELLAQLNLKRTAIITHGGVIRHLLTAVAPEKKGFWEWKVENGRGYELTGSLSALRRGERCISLQAVPSTEKSNG